MLSWFTDVTTTRYQCPADFVSFCHKPCNSTLSKSLKNTKNELWLIKAPASFTPEWWVQALPLYLLCLPVSQSWSQTFKTFQSEIRQFFSLWIYWVFRIQLWIYWALYFFQLVLSCITNMLWCPNKSSQYRSYSGSMLFSFCFKVPWIVSVKPISCFFTTAE